jgi:hypothetical protein
MFIPLVPRNVAFPQQMLVFVHASQQNQLRQHRQYLAAGLGA